MWTGLKELLNSNELAKMPFRQVKSNLQYYKPVAQQLIDKSSVYFSFHLYGKHPLLWESCPRLIGYSHLSICVKIQPCSKILLNLNFGLIFFDLWHRLSKLEMT